MKQITIDFKNAFDSFQEGKVEGLSLWLCTFGSFYG